MKQNSMLMAILLLAIVAAALTITFSIWTLSINYKRLGEGQPDLPLAQGGSMAERQANIETILRSLEQGR